jgi:predicted SAM-dependent methyltransferase
MKPAFEPSPYRYDAILRTRPWVPLLKRMLMMLRMGQIGRRARGREAWSDYTGGWNAAPAPVDATRHRLNLGCGQANYQSYINLDIVAWPHLHVRASGERLPFQTESFDEVLCTDVIEHLDLNAGQTLLNEIYRVLRPRGRLILVTPDLDNIVRAYRSRFATHAQIVQHLLGDARDHRYLYTIPMLTRCVQNANLIVRRSIQHWGPIWAHLVILAEKGAE